MPCVAAKRELLAAMEPAGERRDDAVNAAIARGLPWVPQWSPPVRGGTTYGSHSVLTGVTDDVPQWSPPLIGGSDLQLPCSSTTAVRVAAMEPAAGQRDEPVRLY